MKKSQNLQVKQGDFMAIALGKESVQATTWSLQKKPHNQSKMVV